MEAEANLVKVHMEEETEDELPVNKSGFDEVKMNEDPSGEIGLEEKLFEMKLSVAAPPQLTIFYEGGVRVFDAIPAEKVREIILLAAAANPGGMKNMGISYPTTSSVLTRSPSLQSTTIPLASPLQTSSICKSQAELPIKRRNSLQRFFEKRRDRLGSKNPYPTPTATGMAAKSNLRTEAPPNLGCASSTMPQEEMWPTAIA